MLHRNSAVSLWSVLIVFARLIGTKGITNRFKSGREKRFLFNLISHHQLILEGNAFADDRQSSIGIIASLFNHSCAPNLTNYSDAKFRYLTTIRPVKSGEQLFISYTSDSNSSTQNRQRFLLDNFGFNCSSSSCDKCYNRSSRADRMRVLQDRNYLLIVHFDFYATVISYQPIFFRSYVQNSKTAVERACVEFLNQYGHLPWTEELDFVTNVYEAIRYKCNFNRMYGFNRLKLCGTVIVVIFLYYVTSFIWKLLNS